MSKFVKDLVTDYLKHRLENVNDLLLVSLVGLTANKNTALRRELRGKNLNLLMVKNSLARRATEGTALAPAFEGASGSVAMIWGGDIVAVAKEVSRLSADKAYAPFEARGGVMGGAPLTAAEVHQVSKWPSREEQLSILLGQILSPGANLVSQLTSVGGALASQIEQRTEGAEETAAEATAGTETSA
jgi:large subunit ribosomal protein L10